MKRNLVLTFLACGASLMLGAVAQAEVTSTPSPSPSPGQWTGHHGGEGVLGHLTYALGLTGSQQAQVAQILEAAKPQFQAIREQYKTARNSEIGTVSAQITPLLTGSQQAKFAELVQKVENSPVGGGGGGGHFGRFGHRGGPGGPGGAGMLEHLATALGLSPEQVAQIKPILEAAHAQVKTVFANTSLTPDQKFAQVKDTMDAADGQINGILTAPQQAQFAALKQNHHRWHGQGGEPSPSPSDTPATD